MWTLVLEEHFAEPGLLAYIKPHRRDIYAQDRAKVFLSQFLRRERQRTLFAWRRYCHRRARCRFLVAALITRWRTVNGLDAIAKWRRWTMLVCSAITAQRYIRGWMGRLAGWYINQMEITATVLQTQYRKMRASRLYHEVIARRHWAATEISRWGRGAAARRLVLNMLEGHLDKERAAIARDRFNWENRVLIKATRVVQAAWRHRRQRDKAAAAAAIEAAAAKVEEMKELMDADAFTKRNIYEKALEAWYKEQKRIALSAGGYEV